MGYAMMYGNCIKCNAVFGFNPHKVPSVRANDGHRQPVCKECMDELIAKEKAQGIEPKLYAHDAYDAIDENEL